MIPHGNAPPELEPTGAQRRGRLTFRLAAPYARAWRVGLEARSVTVPAGYVTDLASVPTAVRGLGLVPDGPWRGAAVIHDWLYSVGRGGPLARWRADRVFRRLMAEDGVEHGLAVAMYAAVRVAGGRAFGRVEPENAALVAAHFGPRRPPMLSLITANPLKGAALAAAGFALAFLGPAFVVQSARLDEAAAITADLRQTVAERDALLAASEASLETLKNDHAAELDARKAIIDALAKDRDAAAARARRLAQIKETAHAAHESDCRVSGPVLAVLDGLRPLAGDPARDPMAHPRGDD